MLFKELVYITLGAIAVMLAVWLVCCLVATLLQ